LPHHVGAAEGVARRRPKGVNPVRAGPRPPVYGPTARRRWNVSCSSSGIPVLGHLLRECNCWPLALRGGGCRAPEVGEFGSLTAERRASAGPAARADAPKRGRPVGCHTATRCSKAPPGVHRAGPPRPRRRVARVRVAGAPDLRPIQFPPGGRAHALPGTRVLQGNFLTDICRCDGSWSIQLGDRGSRCARIRGVRSAPTVRAICGLFGRPSSDSTVAALLVHQGDRASG